MGITPTYYNQLLLEMGLLGNYSSDAIDVVEESMRVAILFGAGRALCDSL